MSLVVLDTTGSTWTLVDTSATRKVALGDHEDAEALKAFKDAVTAFVNSHGIAKVVIRRCTYKGQKRSGAASIKMETLLQLLNCEVQLVPSQTIATNLRKQEVELPSTLAAYQFDAFATALWAARSPE